MYYPLHSSPLSRKRLVLESILCYPPPYSLFPTVCLYPITPMILPVAYREREKSEKEKGFRYLFTSILKKIKEEIVHSITANNETFNIDFDID